VNSMGFLVELEGEENDQHLETVKAIARVASLIGFIVQLKAKDACRRVGASEEDYIDYEWALKIGAYEEIRRRKGKQRDIALYTDDDVRVLDLTKATDKLLTYLNCLDLIPDKEKIKLDYSWRIKLKSYYSKTASISMTCSLVECSKCNKGFKFVYSWSFGPYSEYKRYWIFCEHLRL